MNQALPDNKTYLLKRKTCSKNGIWKQAIQIKYSPGHNWIRKDSWSGKWISTWSTGSYMHIWTPQEFSGWCTWMAKQKSIFNPCYESKFFSPVSWAKGALVPFILAEQLKLTFWEKALAWTKVEAAFLEFRGKMQGYGKIIYLIFSFVYLFL